MESLNFAFALLLVTVLCMVALRWLATNLVKKNWPLTLNRYIPKAQTQAMNYARCYPQWCSTAPLADHRLGYKPQATDSECQHQLHWLTLQIHRFDWLKTALVAFRLLALGDNEHFFGPERFRTPTLWFADSFKNPITWQKQTKHHGVQFPKKKIG